MPSDTAPPDPAPARGTVTRLAHQGREIVLIGTAHVSRRSVDEVREVIRELRPDTVCVELDEARLATLEDESRWERYDARPALAEGRAGVLLASLLFAGFQARMGKRLGVRPGEEMVAAVLTARELGAAVVLADRDVQVTLRRCHAALPLLARAQIGVMLALLPFFAPDVSEEDVEKLKERAALGDVLEAFAREMPALERPLITERDAHLAARIRGAPGARVVAVVGAAHVPGIERWLDRPVDLEAITARPAPPRSALRAVGALLVLGLAAAAGLGATLAGDALRGLLVGASAGGLAAALVAGAPPGVALAATALAPLGVALPGLRVGPRLGELALRVSPPRAEDGALLRFAVLSPRAARNNRILAAVATAALVPLLAVMGALLGLGVGLLHP